MFQSVMLVLLCTLVTMVASAAASGEFVAAVYEHAFIMADNTTVVLPKQQAVDIVMRNIDVYEVQIRKAKQQNASIIVFPEYGMTGFGYTRESFKPFLENIPNPKTTTWNACQEPDAKTSAPILYRLSCLAKNYSIYLVVNMGDIKPCEKMTDKHCPGDGRYQYNTNIAFDDKGQLVARYHKQHPFLNEMKVVDRPRTPEYIAFQTPFGKVGTFICFDALFHDPAVPLVTRDNIDHVAFPTAWFDVLPLFAAIGFHGSWARGMEVNFLGANSHVPMFMNTGSGIYSPDGAKAYNRSMSSDGSLLVATLSKTPKKTPSNMTVVNMDNVDTNKEESFYADLFGDLFLFKELSKQEDTLRVCYNGSNTCCSLTYKMAAKRQDEMYAVGVFDGLHTREGRYYMRICTLIKCQGPRRDSCGQPTFNASTIFESFTLQGQLNKRYVFPQVVADGVTLLPGEWDHNMPVTQLQSTHQLSRGLLTAALFGRDYDLDTGGPAPTVQSATSRLSGHLLLAALLSIKACVLPW